MIKLCTIKDINKIKELVCVDGFILPTIYSIYYEKAFSKEEIKEAIILSSALNKKIIVSVDMIICEDDLEEVYSFLDEISSFNCDIMFSDLAVLDYFKKRGELYKLIYNAHTYITNKEDIKYYKK